MFAMPTARPSSTSTATAGRDTRKHTTHLAPFHPGALWRAADGETFRVSKDASRVHYAASHNKRNVIHLSDAQHRPALLPDPLLRDLIARFATLPAWAKAHRSWCARRDVQGQWFLALELRGGQQNRVRFPSMISADRDQPSDWPVNPLDPESFRAVADRLWSDANTYEADPHAPATLSVRT